MVTVNWIGDMAFDVDPPTGNRFVLDSHPEFGGTNKGPTPVEAFLGALAACSAIDVLAILEKKQQKVTGYRIEVDGERPSQGSYPRGFTSLIVRHIVTGVGLDPHAVERAVELSDQKYCTVITTLRNAPSVSSEWRIDEPVA